MSSSRRGGDLRRCFITREEIDERGRFKTGLTLELILSAQDRFGEPAADFARSISARFCATGELLDSGGSETGVLKSSSCTNVRDHDGARSVMKLVAIANKRTDRVHLVVFQSL